MDAAINQGQLDEDYLRQHQASEDQINEWKTQKIAEMRKYNASDKQINDYFGVKEPDTSGMKTYVQKNLKAFEESRKAADGTPQKEAASFGEYFNAGWENSVTGLFTGGHEPDTVLPEHAGFLARLVSNIGQITGDLPAMAAGAVPGTAVGNPLLAGGGAFAAPAGMRKLLMEQYEKGDIKDAGDFTSRLAQATWESIKSGAVGVLTAGAGMFAKPLVGAGGALATELATMTTAGAGMEGHLPSAQEFIDGAALLGGFHLATGIVPTKLRNIYANTGERPAEIVEAAHNDPALKQELLSENQDLPKQAAPVEPKKEPLPETELDKALAGEGKGSEPPKPPEEPPGPPPEPEEVASARSKIRGKIQDERKPESFSFKDLLTPEGREKALLKLRTDYEDSLLPIGHAEDVSGLEFKPGQSPSDLARIAYGSSGVAKRFIGDGKFDGTLDYKTGQRNGEGFGAILNDVGPERIKKFEEFVTARRVVEREGEGFKTGFNLEAAKTIVKADQAEFGELADRYSAFNDKVMQYYADAGGAVDKDAVLNKSKYYAPMARVVSTDPFTGKPITDNTGAKIHFMEGEGSPLDILNPLQQTMKRAAAVARWVARNDAAKAYAEMVKNSENGPALGEIVDKSSGQLRSNEISFYDGERKIIRMPQEYADALKSLGGDPLQTNLFIKIMQVPAQALRVGTVLNPDFLLRHFGRGVIISSIQNSAGALFKNVADTLRGIGHIVAEDEVWSSYLSSGAVQQDIGGALGYINDRFWSVQSEGAPSMMRKLWNTPATLKEGLEYMSMIADNAFRVAEFKRVAGSIDKESGLWTLGSKEEIQKAAISARDVTLDYNRRGAQMQAFASVVPFANIGIQGASRMIRGIAENPVSYGAKAVALITVPSVATYFLNRNDPRYQDAPNWEKDLYWIFPMDKWEKAANLGDAMSRPEALRRQAADGTWEVNNGTTLRVMKPFELGILFGSLPERLLARFIDDNPRALKSAGDSIRRGLIPNVLPTALTPVLEQATNYNFFTGRPVVSSHVEGFLPEYQYNEYTSSVAKTLGKLIGYVPGLRDFGSKEAPLSSPQVIDNYIHDWSGTMGQYVLQAIDKAMDYTSSNKPPPPAMTLAQMPIIKAFIARYPDAKAQSIQDFYDDYEHASRLNATVSMLAKSGDPGSMQKAMQLQGANQGDMLRLTQIKQSLGAMAKSVQGINDMPAKLPDGSPGPTPQEKRQLIDTQYYTMSMIARTGNKIMDQYRKQVKAQASGGTQ